MSVVKRLKLRPGALLAIADDLLADIYTIWLLLPDICRLDSAVCAKWLRPDFLRLVSTKVVRFLREETYTPLAGIWFSVNKTHRELKIKSLNWILKRGINLASLRLSRPLWVLSDRITLTSPREEETSICTAVASLASAGLLDKIETLDIRDCGFIRDSDLAVVIEKSYKSIKHIDIRNCDSLTERKAAEIKRCTGLETFQPYGNETAVEMKDIFQACNKLKTVFLELSHSTPDIMRSVAKNCRLLEHLEAIGNNVCDEGIRLVAESCPLLEYVCVWITEITDISVFDLAVHCPKLKYVELNTCLKLTDMAVLALAEYLPGLVRINLRENTIITSSALETLVSKCHMLLAIDLTYCPNVCDKTLVEIAKHCPVLENLKVAGCPLITESGLTTVMSSCTKIKVFLIDRTHPSRALLEQLHPYVVWC